MPMTAYSRKKLGDHSLGKASITMPTALYAALFANDTAEMVFTGYARIEVTSKFGAFDSVTGIATSSADINFGVPGSDDLPAAVIKFFDASSGGNVWYQESIPNPRTIINGGRALKFKAGTVTIQLI